LKLETSPSPSFITPGHAPLVCRAYFAEVSAIKRSLLIDYSNANQAHRKNRAKDPTQDDILAELERELQLELEGFEDYGMMSPSTANMNDMELLGAMGELTENEDLHL